MRIGNSAFDDLKFGFVGVEIRRILREDESSGTLIRD